jgi:hypothetical protein
MISIRTMYLSTQAVRVGLCVYVLLTCGERELTMGIYVCIYIYIYIYIGLLCIPVGVIYIYIYI